MKIVRRHSWEIKLDEAACLQRTLARELLPGPAPEPIELVAGADAAYDLQRGRVVAGVVVWDCRAGRVVDQALAARPIRFPYVSGFLTFREGPALAAALEAVSSEPQVVIFDGQGQAHPRQMGLAAHLGLFLQRPTVGCAKSLLFGRPGSLGQERGAWADLVHPAQGRIIGRVLRTRTGVKPVFVSPAHLAGLDWASDLILDLAPKYRLPQPIRAAHRLATEQRSAVRPV